MEKLEIASQVLIHSYKHNGTIHRTWDRGFVLHTDQEQIIMMNNKTLVTESDGRKWYTREPAICCFYKSHWFNVICMIRKNGVYYYCNLASPYVYDGEAIKYIDYDLDIKVFPDGKHKILDEDEYALHKVTMSYPAVMDDIMANEMKLLQEMIKKKKGPFSKGFVEQWYQFYQKEIKK